MTRPLQNIFLRLVLGSLAVVLAILISAILQRSHDLNYMVKERK